jgi:hypothetical protein
MGWVVSVFKFGAVALCAVLLFASNGMAGSPGDTAGTTLYDYQTNVMAGQRVAIDGLGGAHVAWMGGYDVGEPAVVYYNYIDSVGNILYPNGLQIYGRGMPQIAVNSTNQPGIMMRALIGDSLLYWTRARVYRLPEGGNWPMLSIDRSDRIHVLYGRFWGWDYVVQYIRSGDGGLTWTAPEVADGAGSLSYMITSSPVSDKVAMIYGFPFDTTNNWSNDICYIQSPDGVNWDWANGRIPVTDYGNDEDSISFNADLDAVYDFNDNLHFVWHTVVLRPDGIGDRVAIFHADQVSETPVEITYSDESGVGCDFGAWNIALSKMSLSVHPSNLLVITYVRFSPDDCSAGGFANGEIYKQHSSQGIIWSPPVNLTNSHTPRCAAGHCDSDHWPSAAERIDGNLHLFYVNDKDAGGIPQSEGQVTENPMLYYRLPLEQVGIDDVPYIPSGFALNQNYPNPFNAKTSIAFKLRRAGRVRLEVFDVLGARVATLLNGRREAGSYQVEWEGGEKASGIYYYCLGTDEGIQSKRMVLLK